MPGFRPRLLSVLVTAAAAGPLPVPAVDAAPLRGFFRAEASAVVVEDAWARASPGNATTGAAYVTLIGGTQPDQLIGVSSQAAKTAEVHDSFTDNGVMKMRPVPALPIAPGQTVTFSPRGYHVMLMGLKQPLVAGQSFPMTFHFEHAQSVTVNVLVRPIGPGSSMHGQDGRM